MRFRNHHAGCCGYTPTRPNGSEWNHVMILHDGSTVHADSTAEVLAELIPGYDVLEDDESRLQARIRHAVGAAIQAQEAFIAWAESAGAFDAAGADAPLLEVLRADKGSSMLLATPDRPGVQAEWIPAVKLVLVTTSYAPYGRYAPIPGRVVWIDPTEEDRYLTSLREARVYDYWAAPV